MPTEIPRTKTVRNNIKNVRDWDTYQWYNGGFRQIAIPRVYIIDRASRDAIENNTETWNRLGFFTDNSKATLYALGRQKMDAAYEAVKKKIFEKAGASEDIVSREFTGDYSDGSPTPEKEDKLFTSTIAIRDRIYQKYKRTKDGKLVSDSEVDAALNEKRNKNKRRGTDISNEDENLILSSSGDDGLFDTSLVERVVDDTSLGGNEAINCYWAYNEDDDIVYPQTAYNANVAGNDGASPLLGMGRVYAENINRYQQILWINFGIPVYKGSITSMFGGSVTQARVINRGNTIASKAGYLVGTIFKIALAFPLLPLYGLAALSNLFDDYPVTKYFEHRSAMPMYYKFCNMLIGHMAINLGLYRPTQEALDTISSIPGFGWTKARDGQVDNSKVPKGSNLYKGAHAGIPEILKYGPDMLMIQLKRGRRAVMFHQSLGKSSEDLRSFFENNSTDDVYSEWLTATADQKEDVTEAYREVYEKRRELKHELDNGSALKKSDKAKKLEEELKTLEKKLQDILEKGGISPGALARLADSKTWGNMFGMIAVSAMQTIDYLGFKVEKSAAVSESASNSTQPLEIASTINGLAQQSYNKKDSLIGSLLSGTTGIAPIDWIAQFVGSVMTSIVDTLGVGNMINVLTGNGFADIPEKWASSSFTRSYNVEFQLRARYGDPVSWLQSVGIPLCCILAGCLPRGVGGSMYTSPFILRCYCKGMFSIPSGIIESCNMTRGDGEFGWTINKLPLCINISLTIKDLSPILYVGIDNDMNSSMDEYMSTLTGVGLYERTSVYQKFMRRLNRALMIGRNEYANPLYWGVNIGNTGIAKLCGNIYAGKMTPN